MKSFSLKLILALVQVFGSPAFAATETIVKADIIEGQITQKNYLKEKGHFEKNAVGWSGYDDGAATPVDGTGGTVSSTCTRTTSTPLSGEGSFLYTPAALGEGCSASFVIDSKDKGRVLQLSFDYAVSSGTYTDDDTTIWIYDVTNAALIQPAPYKIKKTGTTEKFAVEFQTSSSSTTYRLLIHQATAGTAVLKFDNFQLGPQAKLYGSAVTDWVSFTPTGTWSANTTYTGYWRRVGDSAEIIYHIALSGAPTAATLTVNPPSGLTIDNTKAPTGTNIGAAGINSAGTGYVGRLQIVGNTIRPLTTGIINATTPGTFANGDTLEFTALVPIVGWSSSTIMSSDADTRVVAAAYGYASTANATVADNAEEILDFGSKIYDTCGCVTTGASWKFTAPSPGYYRTSSIVSWNNGTNLASTYLRLWKNGSIEKRMDYKAYPSAPADSALTGSATVYLNAGEYIDLRALQDDTASAVRTVAASDVVTVVYIEKIQGPAQVMASDTVAALYTGAPPTGTLTNAYNTTTFGTQVKDSHLAYSSGSYSVPTSGTYSISACTGQAATYAAAKIAITAIFVDGVQKETQIVSAGGVNGTLYPCVSAHSRPLLAGQVVTIRSYNDATTPTFSSSANQNYFSIVRTGNF